MTLLAYYILYGIISIVALTENNSPTFDDGDYLRNRKHVPCFYLA